jgi:hypothetical protein
LHLCPFGLLPGQGRAALPLCPFGLPSFVLMQGLVSVPLSARLLCTCAFSGSSLRCDHVPSQGHQLRLCNTGPTGRRLRFADACSGLLAHIPESGRDALRRSTDRSVPCPFRWAAPVNAALRFRWLGAVAPVALTVPIWPEPFKQCNTVISYSMTSLRSNGDIVEDSLGPEGPTRVTCKRIQCEAEPDRQAR